MLHLDYRDARPIYAQIMDGIREQVISGVLRSGDKLPSVRELASELAINPNTIQRSYRQLELEGWIATVPGKGCFVCAAQSAQQRETDRLWQQFQETVQALTAIGVTREALIQHIRREDETHA